MGRKLFDVVANRKSKNPSSVLLAAKVANQWRTYDAQEVWDTATALAYSLQQLGIQYKKSVDNVDTVAIISNNRPEWVITDLGTQMSGGVLTPIYPTVSVNELAYIFNEAQVKVLFIANKELYERFLPAFQLVPSLQHIFSFDAIEGVNHWSSLINKENHVSADELAKIDDESLATIIYTSGTTGKPKGVMLTHDNIVSNVFAGAARIPLSPGNSRTMSYLPVCHILERFYLYLCQYYGVSIYFGESIDKIGDNLKEVKPNLMTGVPRVLEKVYDKIYAKGLELKGIKKMIFFWSLNLGFNFKPYNENGWWYEFQLKISRKLVFSKWKEGVGGNLEFIACGSAALQPRLARIFAAANITIMEGYGLTETSPLISINDMRNRGYKIGTVGKVVDKVEVKIAEDGEILCKGPNIMLGYYKDVEQTNEVLKDGYFHTGDIGEIDSEGFLKITDRKKEMFKTSGGKYISPQLLENAFKQSRFIEQIMVIGDGQKMPAAFIQPHFEYIKEWQKLHDITPDTSNEAISNNPKVIERIQEEVNIINEKFGNWERVKRFELTPDLWTIDGGHLTPTLKLKRKVVLEKYKELFTKIYG